MGYMHISNLYKQQDILLFKECYALEKIHGTSAHLRWAGEEGKIHYFASGEKHTNFIALFDDAKLRSKFSELFGTETVIVFGEAYGGKQQGQSFRYGKALKFIAFEVKVGDIWLAVPNAEDVAKKLGLEFVFYKKIPAEISAIDAERDAPSEQARRNGILEVQPREGVVLRPLIELRVSNDERVLSKHKREEERGARDKDN